MNNSVNMSVYIPERVNILENAPIEFALPLYGYLLPVLVSITTVTNSFIIIVLSQKHLRTPTNYVLFSMALSDMLIGLSSLPWFLYYYTFKGYKIDEVYGLSPFWCSVYPYISTYIPTIFRTCANWLAVYLAVQRYVYVCVPASVHRYCTPRTTKIIIITIFTVSFISVLPEMFALFYVTRKEEGDRFGCYLKYSYWVMHIFGIQLYHITTCTFKAFCVSAIPCVLLMIFTCKLAKTIKKAENRKRSWTTSAAIQSNFISCTQGDRENPTLTTNSRLSSANMPISTGSFLSGSNRSLYATNRMLLVVCIVFLILEVPAAVIYILHFLTAADIIPAPGQTYHLLNILLIIRNILVILTSPIQFIIYCSMSEQFRLTVRQLFSTRLLYVTQAQATFHGGKRYSLILVDLELIEEKRKEAEERMMWASGNKKISLN
uniref:G-protein coupled receptor (inferred by orthology to a D. melanogaster protein) n=1 Tax=Strongyloides venezuelensis TaxID=75913 RepID=A0A0K0FBS5_STRVS